MGERARVASGLPTLIVVDDDEDRRTIDDVVTALRSAIERAGDLGSSGVSAIGQAVDDAVHRLVRQRIDRVLSETTQDDDDERSTSSALARSLEPGTTASTVTSTARRVGRTAARYSSRARTLRAATSRTPIGMALSWLPALVDAITTGARQIDAIATNLVARARQAGVEPDPERLERVVVQVLTSRRPDPDEPADHHRLARTWVMQVGRGAAPFGTRRLVRRIGSAAPDSAEIVGRVADIDVTSLG